MKKPVMVLTSVLILTSLRRPVWMERHGTGRSLQLIVFHIHRQSSLWIEAAHGTKLAPVIRMVSRFGMMLRPPALEI
jgi:hypothetical protein